MKTFDAVESKHRVTLQLSALDHDRSFMRFVAGRRTFANKGSNKQVRSNKKCNYSYGRIYYGGAMLLIIVTKHIVVVVLLSSSSFVKFLL